MGQINDLAKQAYEASKAKGFHDHERNIGEMLMLIVSELGEALEAHRVGKIGPGPLWRDLEDGEDITAYYNVYVKGGFEEEIADTMIRLFDLSAYMGIDIEKHIDMKMRFNAARPHKHGKKY